jgi:hypothetical protein
MIKHKTRYQSRLTSKKILKSPDIPSNRLYLVGALPGNQAGLKLLLANQVIGLIIE